MEASVLGAVGSYLFPSRTQQSSPPAPKILGTSVPGKIGQGRDLKTPTRKRRGLLFSGDSVMRAAAPPYAGEGPHALWHVSEDPTITRFAPHRAKTAATDEPLVWAIDTRHLPLYWFPRDCPRCTFWAGPRTTEGDVTRFLGGRRERRVHVREEAGPDPGRDARPYDSRPDAGSVTADPRPRGDVGRRRRG